MFSLGIHIEEDFACFSLAELKKKKVKIHFSKKYELNHSEVDQKSKEEEFYQIFSDLYNQVKSKKPQVVLSMPQKHIITRKKSFPFKERNKIKKNLQFQMSDEVIFNDPVFCFKKLNSSTKNQSLCLVEAAKKSEVQKYYDFISKVCPVDIITSEAFSLNNLLEDFSSTKKKNSFEAAEYGAELLIYIGEDHTNLILRKNSEDLEDVSFMLWGYKNIVHTFTQRFKISSEEAYSYLKNLNLDNKSHVEQKLYQTALLEALEESLNELKLKIKDYKSKNVHVESIVLTGLGADLKALHSRIEESLQMPTETLSEFKNIHSYAEKIDKNASSMSCGLCLEAFKNYKNPVCNFLSDIKDHKTSLDFFSIIKKLAIPALGFLFLFSFILFYAISRDKLSSQASNQSYKQLKKIARFANITGVRGFKKKVKKFISENKMSQKMKTSNINQVSNYLSALDVLQKLSSVFSSSKNLDISYLDLKENFLELKVKVRKDQIQDLKTKLESMKIFKRLNPITESDGLFHVQLEILRLKK